MKWRWNWWYCWMVSNINRLCPVDHILSVRDGHLTRPDQTCNKQIDEMSQNNIQVPTSPPPGYEELFDHPSSLPLSPEYKRHRVPPPPYPGNDIILDITRLEDYSGLPPTSWTVIDNDARFGFGGGYRSYRDNWRYWRWRSFRRRPIERPSPALALFQLVMLIAIIIILSVRFAFYNV